MMPVLVYEELRPLKDDENLLPRSIGGSLEENSAFNGSVGNIIVL